MRYHWGMGIGHVHAHGIPETLNVQPIEIAPFQYDEAQEDGADQGNSLPECANSANETDANSTGNKPGMQTGSLAK